MSKFWRKVKAFVARLDTKDARRGVADDLKKASYALFALFLVSWPGSFQAFLQALAATFGVTTAALKVSTATLVLLLFGAFSLRVVAFILECDLRDAPEKKKQGKRGK